MTFFIKTICRLNFNHRGFFVVSSTRAMSQRAALESEVLFDTAGKIGFITLNRPKQLNTLTLNMVRIMYLQLRRYEADPEIGAIVVRGAGGGRAFCAGGDAVSITQMAKSSDPSDAYNFFREEYLLDYAMSLCTKPYISLIDGVTMGGGFNISVHGKYRVATERTVFAMPESHLGVFPDICGGYFLARLPRNLGVFLGLTGYWLKGWDVYKAGIATHFCRAEILPELERVLARLYEPTQESVQRVLDDFHSRSSIDNSVEFILKPHLEKIANLFEANATIEKILDNLETEGSEWSLSQIEILRKASPTSLKITQKQFQNGDNLELAECLQVDFRLIVRCCGDNDFAEGVRALLVDKDKNPKWIPQSVEEVLDERVDFYFSPLAAPLAECEVAKEYEKPIPPQSKL